MTGPTCEALELLAAKATDGPWQMQAPDEVDMFVPIIAVNLDEAGIPIGTPTRGLVAGTTLHPTEIDAQDFTRAIATAEYVVAAVNALPSLIATIREQSTALAEADRKNNAILAEWNAAESTIRHLSEQVRVKDEEIARLRGDASRFSATFQRFPDGSLKPFLSPDRYDDLRNDDRFLYNRGPKPEGLK